MTDVSLNKPVPSDQRDYYIYPVSANISPLSVWSVVEAGVDGVVPAFTIPFKTSLALGTLDLFDEAVLLDGVSKPSKENIGVRPLPDIARSNAYDAHMLLNSRETRFK